MRCRSLAEETGAGSCRGGALRAALAAEDTAASAALYVLLRAADRFHQTYQRYPGSYDRWVAAWRPCCWLRGRPGAGSWLPGGPAAAHSAASSCATLPQHCPTFQSRSLRLDLPCPSFLCCAGSHARPLRPSTPSRHRSEVEEDAALLKSQAQALLAECGAGGGAAGVADDLVGEVCRCAAGELHVVAAVVGAVAAQEAIKIVTGQFVPLGGVLIYNAMACTSSVFAF